MNTKLNISDHNNINNNLITDIKNTCSNKWNNITSQITVGTMFANYD